MFRFTRLAVSAALASCALAGAAHAADRVKIGLLSTLSGPGSGLGIDIRDGFQLALKHTGNKLGGLPAEVIVADDQQSPESARQTTESLRKRDNDDFITVVVFSNVMLAVKQTVIDTKTFNISTNASPSHYAGEQYSPRCFNGA